MFLCHDVVAVLMTSAVERALMGCYPHDFPGEHMANITFIHDLMTSTPWLESRMHVDQCSERLCRKHAELWMLSMQTRPADDVRLSLMTNFVIHDTTPQRTHDVIITSLLRQNNAAASFWRNDDVKTTSQRCFDVIMTLSLRHVPAAICHNP